MVWFQSPSPGKLDTVFQHVCQTCLTHPNLSEAALSQFDVEAERLSGDLPGVPGQPLGLWLQDRAHLRQTVTQPVSMLWEMAGSKKVRYNFILC